MELKDFLRNSQFLFGLSPCVRFGHIEHVNAIFIGRLDYFLYAAVMTLITFLRISPHTLTGSPTTVPPKVNPIPTE
jgi:hypothetical protein